jgi:UDP-glucose 4-epimerase
LNDIETTLASLRYDSPDQHASAAPRRHINVVWSAGKCGFSSEEPETSDELATFTRIVEFAEKLSRRDDDWAVRFYHISSAGGLFEGLDGDAVELRPAPIRPYGVLKLKQELLVDSLPKAIQKKVFRLSSVYGHIAPNSRSGLVQTLLINGVQRRPSVIVGDLSTLRDYVFCEDVGRFVCDQLLAPTDGASSCYLLSSGKASSIGEVQRYVESAIGRRIYLSFERRPSNGRDICLSWREMPVGWSPVDLRTGIRTVHDNWRDKGYAWQG